MQRAWVAAQLRAARSLDARQLPADGAVLESARCCACRMPKYIAMTWGPAHTSLLWRKFPRLQVPIGSRRGQVRSAHAGPYPRRRTSVCGNLKTQSIGAPHAPYGAVCAEMDVHSCRRVRAADCRRGASGRRRGTRDSACIIVDFAIPRLLVCRTPHTAPRARRCPWLPPAAAAAKMQVLR